MLPQAGDECPDRRPQSEFCLRYTRELSGLAGFIHSWEEAEYQIQSGDMKRLEHKAGCFRHSHFPASCVNLVVTGNEAANTRTVDLGYIRKIENDGALSFAQQITDKRGDLFAFGSHQYLPGDANHHLSGRNLVMAYLHRCEADHCMSF